VTRSVEAAAWVADGIDPEFEVATDFGIAIEFTKEVHHAEDSGGFVAMDSGEDAQFDAVFDDPGPLKPEARDPEQIFAIAPFQEGVGGQALGVIGLNGERQQEFSQVESVSFLEAGGEISRGAPDLFGSVLG
jgi:hypothetical protein